MEKFIGQRVALHFLQKGKGLVGLTSALELDEHRSTGKSFEQSNEFGSLDRKGLGICVLSVKNRGDAIGFAKTAGCAAAGLGALGNVEFVLLAHGFVPPVTPELEAGVLEKGVR